MLAALFYGMSYGATVACALFSRVLNLPIPALHGKSVILLLDDAPMALMSYISRFLYGN